MLQAGDSRDHPDRQRVFLRLNYSVAAAYAADERLSSAVAAAATATQQSIIAGQPSEEGINLKKSALFGGCCVIIPAAQRSFLRGPFFLDRAGWARPNHLLIG